MSCRCFAYTAFAVFLVSASVLRLHSFQPKLRCFTSLHFNPSIYAPNPLSISPAMFRFVFYPSAPCDFHLSQIMASEWWTCIYPVSELSYFSSLHINITITTVVITSFTMRGALLSSKQLQKVHYLGRSGDIDGSIQVLPTRKRAGFWRTHLSFCLFSI